MATLPDEVMRPLVVVDSLLEQRTRASEPLAISWGEQEHFQKALDLDNEERLARIPSLSDAECVDAVPPFSLVRYRCQVQDIFEPENFTLFYEEHSLGATRVEGPRLVTSKYREFVDPGAHCEFRSLGNAGLSRRGVCYCVPLPGETRWAREAGIAWSASSASVRLVPSAGQTAPRPKRSRAEEDVEMGAAEEPPKCPPRVVSAAAAQGTAAAEACGAHGPAGCPALTPKTAEEFGLNLPLPWEEQRGKGWSTPCIVKLYDRDEDSLRLGETVEIIGVLCIDPEGADFEPMSEQLFGDARRPSTSLVPRLHALAVRRLPFYNPAIPFSPSFLTETRLAIAWQRSFAEPGALAAARTAALEPLRQVLGGDALAAEYVLMLLVSRTFSKIPDTPLGKWALNLTAPTDAATFPDGWAALLTEAIGTLAPRAVHLSVTTETLNTRAWRPRKDFELNRLLASQLQLASGTVLVLDETQMGVGNLTADGVRAVKAISDMVSEQQLTCDFQVYDMRFPLEVLSILVSKSRSIIREPLVTAVPLRRGESGSAYTVPSAAAGFDAARVLLGLVTRQPQPMKIPEHMAEMISNDFANMRKAYGVSSDLCHIWLSLARAYCLTYGESELTPERWRALLALETERLQRCAAERFLDPSA